MKSLQYTALRWRHNEWDGVSNHQPYDCLLNCLSGRRSKKTSKPASLAFVRGIHRRPVNYPHKWPVTRKLFPFDDVIMVSELTRKLENMAFVTSILEGRFWLLRWSTGLDKSSRSHQHMWPPPVINQSIVRYNDLKKSKLSCNEICFHVTK